MKLGSTFQVFLPDQYKINRIFFKKSGVLHRYLCTIPLINQVGCVAILQTHDPIEEAIILSPFECRFRNTREITGNIFMSVPYLIEVNGAVKVTKAPVTVSDSKRDV